ncbi:MAG: PKD domain-containing protein, partial [Cyclobacteriaceae bacterium]
SSQNQYNITSTDNLFGISMIREAQSWKGIVVGAQNAIHSIDFVDGLTSIPTVTKTSGLDLQNPRDILLEWELDSLYGFVTSSTGDLYKLNFGVSALNKPQEVNLGNFQNTLDNNRGLSFIRNKDSNFLISIQSSSGQISLINFPNVCGGYVIDNSPQFSYQNNGVYAIGLTAIDDNGNRSTFLDSITVSNVIAPQIDVSIDDNRCIDVANSFSVIGETSDIQSYTWNFGDGNTSSQPDTTYQYQNTGRYEINLFVESTNGCTNSTTQEISIYDPPAASFMEADQSYCVDDAILLTNTSIFSGPDSVVAYSWLTASQSFTATGDTSVIFTEAGEQPIRLTASIPGCESDTLRTININASPEVAFDWQDDCFGEETQFINSTTGNGITGYLWDLGDGTSATINEPSYAYQAPGKYPVSLTATNDLSCASTEVDTLVIHALPQVGFEMELACADQPVRFLDTTTVADANITQWAWVFADQGSSTEQNPEFTFSAPGAYEVELTTSSNFECIGTTTRIIQVLKAPAPSITIEQGCLGDPVLLTDNTTQDEDNPITGYLWEIENVVFNNDSVSYDFPGPGTYPVSLTVDYENLCSVTTTTSVIIEEPIAVAFEHTTACDNDFAQFIDRSVAPGDSIVSRTWDFAGLATANGPSTFFNFAVAGTYEVTLIVTTLKGCTASTTQEVIVNPSPIADFSPSTNFGPPPLEVDFFNRSEGATNYLWFVEPSTQPISSEENASFTFTELGTYTVTLIARSEVGCTDTTSQSIRVDFPLYDLSIDNIQTEVVGDKINIIVRVTNYGTIDIDGFDINIDLPGGISLSEPFDQPILHQTSLVQTLNTQLPADTPLDQICVSLPTTYETFADERPDNNEACASFRFTALFTDPYPNPTAFRTRIDITLPEAAPVVMELVSLGGQVVRREDFNDLSEGLNPVYLDVSSLPFGVYQLRFIHQDGVTMKRVIVADR